MCPHGTISGNSGQCSIPVYDIRCCNCGKVWTIGESDLISFFATFSEEVSHAR